MFHNKINNIFVDTSPPFLIAEVGLAHDGSLGLAHSFIDAIACTGADAVKFQTHIAEEESSDLEEFRIKFSTQDESRFAYWKRTSFTSPQWAELKKHAEDKGLVFLSSPFSVAAVELLDNLGIEGWKIPSGELNSRRMLEKIALTGKPIFASTGMSTMCEVDKLITNLEKMAPRRHVILQCTTEYPTPPEHVGMNVFDEYKARYSCPVGLSDHSGSVWPSIIAASKGAKVIEVHVALSADMFGPDISSSLSIQDLRLLAEGLNFVHKMILNPLDKDGAATKKVPLRKLFSKSAMVLSDVSAGTFINESLISFRKPGIGLGEDEFDQISNRRLVRSVSAGKFLSKEDFE
jgi:N,N'-diacetyllegionaminate synthase